MLFFFFLVEIIIIIITIFIRRSDPITKKETVQGAKKHTENNNVLR